MAMAIPASIRALSLIRIVIVIGIGILIDCSTGSRPSMTIAIPSVARAAVSDAQPARNRTQGQDALATYPDTAVLAVNRDRNPGRTTNRLEAIDCDCACDGDPGKHSGPFTHRYPYRYRYPYRLFNGFAAIDDDCNPKRGSRGRERRPTSPE
jgi:hypothetical protein